jgi:hypothetical protein
MTGRRINSTVFYRESIMLILVLLIGFWIIQNSSCNKTFRGCSPVKTEISLNHSSATIFQGIQEYFFNGWISQNDYLKIPSLSRLQLIDNKTITRKIFSLEKIRVNPGDYLISFIQHQFFQQESDDPLILS